MPESQPIPAPIIWSGAEMMVVLCPFCNNPDYVKLSTGAKMSQCLEGEYEPKGRFDFKLATQLLRAREKANAYKVEWRKRNPEKAELKDGSNSE
jgi:hypothetical protein